MSDRGGEVLACQPIEEGLVFRVGDPPIPVEEWTARADTPSGLGALIRLRDDGLADDRNPSQLLVQWSGVASLSAEELRYLRLPRPRTVRARDRRERRDSRAGL